MTPPDRDPSNAQLSLDLQESPAPAGSADGSPVRPPDDEHRDLLLLRHLAQVRFVALHIHGRLPPQVLLDDLIHAGILGLFDAIAKYDPARNVQFKHYAEFRIRGAILDSLRQVDWSPRALRFQARRLDQAVAVCRAKLGRDPTESEIAIALHISLDRFQHLLADLYALELPSAPPDLDQLAFSAKALWGFCGAEQDPYHQTLRAEMKVLLTAALDRLPSREQRVLALYDLNELTMKEVGAAMGISESRVSQVRSSAMFHLRRFLSERLHGHQAEANATAVAAEPQEKAPGKALMRSRHKKDRLQKRAG